MSFGGGFAIGGNGKHVDVGVGFLLTQFKNANGPYVPAFLDVSIHSSKRIARPFIDLQAGWGFYRSEINGGYDETGGLFLRPGAGMWLPLRRSAIFLRAFYVRSSFSVANGRGQEFGASTESGWSASLGISF